MSENLHENQSSNRNWQKWIAILIGVMVLVFCIAIGMVFWSLRDYDPLSADTNDPSIIEGNAEITLPPSVHNIQSHHEGLREIAVQVRFVMSANELPGFLEQHCKTEPNVSDIRQELQQRLDREWWTPTKATRFQWCSGDRENFSQTIFVDMTDSETYIVYVVAGMM